MRMHRSALGLIALLLLALAGPAFGQRLDETPRTAVMTAMPPEMSVLRPALSNPRRIVDAGVEFWVGELEGRPVVLFLSGVSMTNAAMNTQAALDRFHIVRIVYSGVAGGVDPSLHVGDVIVPRAWGPYMEARFMREQAGGGFPAPEAGDPANYGMMFPHVEPVQGPAG